MRLDIGVVSCIVILVYVILCHFLSVSYLTVVHVNRNDHY